MKRRKFLQGLLAAGAGLAISSWRYLAKLAPVRRVEARRASRYPGPVKEMNAEEIAKPGKWAG